MPTPNTSLRTGTKITAAGLSFLPYAHVHSFVHPGFVKGVVDANQALPSQAAMTMNRDAEDADALDRTMEALCLALSVLDSQGLAKPALHVSLAIDLLQRLGTDIPASGS